MNLRRFGCWLACHDWVYLTFSKDVCRICGAHRSAKLNTKWTLRG